jgi:hypothetical protein
MLVFTKILKLSTALISHLLITPKIIYYKLTIFIMYNIILMIRTDSLIKTSIPDYIYYIFLPIKHFLSRKKLNLFSCSELIVFHCNFILK